MVSCAQSRNFALHHIQTFALFWEHVFVVMLARKQATKIDSDLDCGSWYNEEKFVFFRREASQ